MLQREAQQVSVRIVRWQTALITAQQAAAILKEKFNLDQVWLFGSLLHQPTFTLQSDIDLAITQLPAEDYLVAVASLQDICPEFKIDLIQLDKCPSSLRETVLCTGGCYEISIFSDCRQD